MIPTLTVTGTTNQAPGRPTSELTTGELTAVQQITVNWPSPPSPADIAAFERDFYGSPAYALTHVSTPTAARYWRLFADTVLSGTSVEVPELQMRETPGGVDVTSTTFAIDDPGHTGIATSAFDNNPAIRWAIPIATDPALWWVGQDFGAGNEKTINEIVLTSAGSPQRTPNEFRIQRSDDGITWIDSWAVSTTAWAADETRTFTRPA